MFAQSEGSSKAIAADSEADDPGAPRFGGGTLPDIVALGECMIELLSDEPIAEARSYRKAFAGDTMNAMYMASKLGSSCGYITRLAEDPFSDYLLREWSAQGIDASASRRVPGFTGVHFVTQLPGGERDFLYYRSGSAASTMKPEDLDAGYVENAKVLHVSGILQAVSESCRSTVLEAVRIASEGGALVSYDTNLRLSLTSPARAREAMMEVLPFADVVLPSFPDETLALTGLDDEGDVVSFFQDLGAKNVALKRGALGVLAAAQGERRTLPAVAPRGVVDTTGAGDAFVGGLLHRLARGSDLFEAARWGVAAAGLKVGGRGAILSQPSRAEVEELVPEVRALPA